MKFYTAKKKAVNVPILSLLDILAILLIYTVVSSEFKKDDEKKERQQAALKVNVPSTDSLDTKTITEDRSQIVLSQGGDITLDGELIEKDLLVTYLQMFKETRPKGKLEIKADQHVTLAQQVYMLESLKKAGISAAEVPWLIKDKRR